jgi:hypothetical protein
MNLNLKPRMGYMGNGTFRAGSYWTQGSRGSFLGDGWGATKHFFTSNTNPSRIYDPLRQYDFFTDKYRIPYDTDAVATILRPHMERAEMSLDEKNRIMATLTQVIKANEGFERDVTDYYGTRVSRTSGGKRDRLRAERAALRGESETARKIAAAGINDIRNLKIAELKSVMPTDPDLVVSTRDPDSGATVYRLSTPGAAPGAASSGSGGTLGMPNWLLPVGAGLAAFMFLKG